MMAFLEKTVKTPFFLLLCIAMGVIFFYWPGFLSPDSTGQLAQAIAGTYTDAHPPIMALYWGLWTGWKQGPEPIFLTHQFLLFGSTFLLLKTFKNHKIAWFIPFTPLIPHILFYSGAIWKDVAFAYSFLGAALLLLRATVDHKNLSFFQIICIWILLFYGTGVKYQALFVLPIMALWFAMTLCKKAPLFKKILVWIALWSSILGSCHLLQKTLVPPKISAHMWQYVKLYDLAGMSVHLDKELFPEFVKHNPEYSFDKVKKVYKPDRMDELMIGTTPDSSLQKGATQQHRDILWNTWFQAIQKHPFSYLKHRFALWKTMVTRSPMKSLDDLTDINSLPPKVKFVLQTIGLKTVIFIKELTRFIYYTPLLFFYFFLGLWRWSRTPRYAIPLTMMTGSGIALMAALFIFSMASDLRYIYLTMTFFHFSHPLAWRLLFPKKT